MNKTEFIKATAKRAGVKQDTAEAIINAALDVATETISSRQEIKLQLFGTFQVKQRHARGRNFQTGQPMPLRAVNYVHFEAAGNIQTAINKGEPDEMRRRALELQKQFEKLDADAGA